MPANVSAETDAASIEVEYTVAPPDPPAPSVEPRPIDGPAPLTRSDVLRCSRAIQAQVVGMSGAIETAAFTPGRVRPEFLNAWHAWAGDFLANCARLERELWKMQAEAQKLAGYAARRDEWRAGIAAELGRSVATVGAQETPKPAPEPWSSAPRKWPWFIWMPVGAGSLFAAYISVRWVFRKCMESINDAGDREQSGEDK